MQFLLSRGDNQILFYRKRHKPSWGFISLEHFMFTCTNIYVKQIFVISDAENNQSKVTRYDYLEVPKILKFLQTLFDKIMKVWFVKVWDEDVQMRKRRIKVWNLGFKDFKGIEYINNPNLKKKDSSKRPYELKLPIPKTTHIKTDENESVKTFIRLFKKSKHLGYGLPDL